MSFSHLKVTIILISCIPALCLSQDIHFSQFQKAPLFVNSAQTGIYDGDFRFNGLYRSQWYKIDQPFNSMQLSFDTKTKFRDRLFGIGGLFVHDQSSSQYLTVDKFYVTLSHSWFHRNHQFVLGLQPGYILKDYDNSNITFGSQFDPSSGSFNPFLPNNEDQLLDQLSYFDLNAGLFWRARMKDMTPTAGLSLQHINRPTESFYSNSNSTNLDIKYSLHGSIGIPLTEKMDVEPLVYYNTTTATHEFLLGGNYHYYPQLWLPTIRKLTAYTVVRVNPFTNIDAWVIGGSIQILDFDIGLSYDVNVSDLRNASNYQGAYEISFVYITNKKKKANKPEPCYIM